MLLMSLLGIFLPSIVLCTIEEDSGFYLSKLCPSEDRITIITECRLACNALQIPLSGKIFKEGRPCYKGGKNVCNQNGAHGRSSLMVCKRADLVKTSPPTGQGEETTIENIDVPNYILTKACPVGTEVVGKTECIDACTQLGIPISEKKFKPGRKCYKNGKGVCNQNGAAGSKATMICKLGDDTTTDQGKEYFVAEQGELSCKEGSTVMTTEECKVACKSLEKVVGRLKGKNLCYIAGNGKCRQDGRQSRKTSLVCSTEDKLDMDKLYFVGSNGGSCESGLMINSKKECIDACTTLNIPTGALRNNRTCYLAGNGKCRQDGRYKARPSTKSSPICKTNDPCVPNPCQNNGMCSVESNSFNFTCQCSIGWSGSTCEKMMGSFVAIPTNECPCTVDDDQGCDRLEECSYSMSSNDLCEADQILPDGNSNYDINNCLPSQDVFRYVPYAVECAVDSDCPDGFSCSGGYCDLKEPCLFKAISISECPCTDADITSSDDDYWLRWLDYSDEDDTGCAAAKCHNSMFTNAICDAYGRLPDGNRNFEIDNCPGNNNVFKCVRGCTRNDECTGLTDTCTFENCKCGVNPRCSLRTSDTCESGECRCGSGAECSGDVILCIDGVCKDPCADMSCGKNAACYVDYSGNARCSCLGAFPFGDSLTECYKREVTGHCRNSSRDIVDTNSSIDNLISPKYPKDYDNNLFCSWKIIAPVQNKIKLTFLDFNTEEYTDNLFIYDEEINERARRGKLVTVLSGENPKTFLSSVNIIYVDFKTDSDVTMPGFQIKISNILGNNVTSTSSIRPLSTVDIDPPACRDKNTELVNVTDQFKLLSPGYPLPYPNDADCLWHFTTSEGYMLVINFTLLEMEEGFDFVHVYDGDIVDAESLVDLTKYTYSKNIPILKSSSNNILMQFRSDYSINRAGFILVVTRAEPLTSDPCGITTDQPKIISELQLGEIGEITSENYPLHANCHWSIETAAGYIIRITLLEFDLENGKDFLHIYDGSSFSNTTLATFTGSNPTVLPIEVQSTGSKMYIHFTSDGQSTANIGYRIRYQSGCQNSFSCDCDGIYGCDEFCNTGECEAPKFCNKVRITTKDDGHKNSWKLGSCTSNRTYENNQQYIEECCLPSGVHQLTCQRSDGNGWSGGYIEIDKNGLGWKDKYCEDFQVGSEKKEKISFIGKNLTSLIGQGLFRCSTWPQSQNYGCAYDETWMSLASNMTFSDLENCEKLCKKETFDWNPGFHVQFICCYLDKEGCFWKPNSFSLPGANVDGIAITCSLENGLGNNGGHSFGGGHSTPGNPFNILPQDGLCLDKYSWCSFNKIPCKSSWALRFCRKSCGIC